MATPSDAASLVTRSISARAKLMLMDQSLTSLSTILLALAHPINVIGR